MRFLDSTFPSSVSKTGWSFWSCGRRAARGWPQPLTVRFGSFSSKADRPQGKLRAAFMRPQQPHTYFNLNYSPSFSADAGNYLCVLASWQPALSSEVSQIDLHVFHSPPLRETNPHKMLTCVPLRRRQGWDLTWAVAWTEENQRSLRLELLSHSRADLHMWLAAPGILMESWGKCVDRKRTYTSVYIHDCGGKSIMTFAHRNCA